ncbi:hypothetical protein [Flavobacterium panacagri]|uniref:hypothetical protein n=1 Tax=Flavobacterium panacagri TaxID=3034146 RepID=UPI0025A5F2D8|nr:hypothetical protein [Flavobacterium panacagri]
MKKIIIVLSISILITLITSCKKEDDKNEIIVYEDNSCSYFQRKMNNLELMDSLSKRVIEHGDTLAYNQIQGIYNIAEQKQTSALYYALIMANKYNYNRAYRDVYEILNSDKVDKKTNEMAESYLKKYKKEK